MKQSVKSVEVEHSRQRKLQDGINYKTKVLQMFITFAESWQSILESLKSSGIQASGMHFPQGSN